MDELVLPFRTVRDLVAAAGLLREEVVVITQCSSLGAVPSWCSTQTPLVTGGLSSSSSRWLPRTSLKLSALELHYFLMMCMYKRKLAMGVACHRAWIAPWRNGLVVAYPGYCCLQSSRSYCLGVHISELLLPATSPSFFCSFRSPLLVS